MDVIWQPGVLQMSCICILIRGRNGENNRLAAGATPLPLTLHPRLSPFARFPHPFPLLAPATQASFKGTYISPPLGGGGGGACDLAAT